MQPTTHRASDDCSIFAERNGVKIGQMEYVTYIKEGDAAMGTVSFSDCIADPRGCDIVVEQYLHVGVLRQTFYGVNLSDNLYLETPIVFVTDTYAEEAI